MRNKSGLSVYPDEKLRQVHLSFLFNAETHHHLEQVKDRKCDNQNYAIHVSGNTNLIVFHTTTNTIEAKKLCSFIL